jgi:hypothetical protein
MSALLPIKVKAVHMKHYLDEGIVFPYDFFIIVTFPAQQS